MRNAWTISGGAALAWLALAAAPAAAQPADGGVAACRAIEDAARRLACYDRATAPEAAAAPQPAAPTEAEVREAERGLFGASVARAPEERAERRPPVRAVESTIAGVSPVGFNLWQLSLSDGATWRTTETATGQPDPKPGDKVRIRRAAMGSYMLTVNDRRPIRARRVG